MTARRKPRFGAALHSGWQSKATRRSNADLDHAWEVEKQRQRDAALAAAKEAVGKPAANDDQTEKKQNG